MGGAAPGCRRAIPKDDRCSDSAAPYSGTTGAPTTGFLHCWAGLRTIPPATTWSYGQLAARLNRPGSSRAVGAANGANPIAIVVPCHRVIRSDGALGGYGFGGVETKRALLAREGLLLTR